MKSQEFKNRVRVNQSNNKIDSADFLLSSFKNFAEARLLVQPNRTEKERRIIDTFIAIATNYKQIESQITEILNSTEKKKVNRLNNESNTTRRLDKYIEK